MTWKRNQQSTPTGRDGTVKYGTTMLLLALRGWLQSPVWCFVHQERPGCCSRFTCPQALPARRDLGESHAVETERWPSGLRRWIANPVWGFFLTAGSNPALSAKFSWLPCRVASRDFMRSLPLFSLTVQSVSSFRDFPYVVARSADHRSRGKKILVC